jgi:FMN-dependent NADH-azoreductase
MRFIDLVARAVASIIVMSTGRQGLFSDQKWIILAPVFFDKVVNRDAPGL